MFQYFKRIPFQVWILGIADALLDVSAAMIFIVSGPFMKEILKSGPIAMGMLEGIVELVSWGIRLISGILSDYLRNRKGIMIIGYAIVILSRPVLALATNIQSLSLGRSLDRIGKGIQATPREAFVADISPMDVRGASFGLRHSLGMIGSMAGALVVYYLFSTTQYNYRLIFWLSSVPALIALLFLIFRVQEVASPECKNARISLKFKDLLALGKGFWCITIVSIFFMLCRCSEVFITLRAIELGIRVEWIPFIMMTYNLAESVISYPIGRLSDYIGRPWCIGGAIILLSLANFIIGIASSKEFILLGSFLWGIQRGIGHSIFLSWIADNSPIHLRATAYGAFYLMSGVALFCANVISGIMINFVSYQGLYISHTFLGILPFVTLIWFVRKSNPQFHDFFETRDGNTKNASNKENSSAYTQQDQRKA